VVGLHFGVVKQRHCRTFIPVSLHTLPLLGAFAHLRKATVSFVRPSTWNNSAPTGRIFVKFHMWVFS